MTVKLHKNKAWLYKRRITEGKSIEQMAEEAKISVMTIRRALEKEGLR